MTLSDVEHRVSRMEHQLLSIQTELIVLRAAISLGRWLVPVIVSVISLTIVIFKG